MRATRVICSGFLCGATVAFHSFALRSNKGGHDQRNELAEGGDRALCHARLQQNSESLYEQLKATEDKIKDAAEGRPNYSIRKTPL